MITLNENKDYGCMQILKKDPTLFLHVRFLQIDTNYQINLLLNRYYSCESRSKTCIIIEKKLS